MEFKWNFLSVVLIILLNLASGKKKESVVPYAINAIIEQHFVNLETSPGKVDIYYFGSSHAEFFTSMDKLLKIKSEDVSIRVFDVQFIADINGITRFEIFHSSIVFFESVERFKVHASIICWVSNESHRGDHLVYVPGLTTLDIIDTFENGFNIDHVNFLMHETDNTIELVTTYMFTLQACKHLQLKSINRFDVRSLEWENAIFYPNKYENFYGCELIVAWNEDDYFYFYFYNLTKMIFEEQLRAKLTRNSDENTWNCVGCDLTSQEQAILTDHYVEGTVSDPVNFNSYNFVIAPGVPYTDLERMFMMFDFELWIAISVTLTIALFATLTLNFVSAKIRNFIVGRYVQHPTMNLLSIFLTGGQSRVPGRNFARFIFVLFVIWSLIIRTCHQSMLFELMQADLRRPTIKTLDEFFQSSLTYYDYNGSFVFDEHFKEQMKKTSTRLVK